jgi:hypothetical protein
MNPSVMALAFNEWMRRYIEEPDRFEHEFQSVASFNAAVTAGKIPTYGEKCAAYLETLVGELAPA